MLVKCIQCEKLYDKPDKEITRNRQYNYSICSRQCQSKFYKKSQIVKCKNCQKTFEKSNTEIKRSKNNFCCRSCSTTFNNKNKKHGTRRSKLEIYLEEQLSKLYPNLQILYNSKEIINSELDIYIPSLKLAFELNGIFHYEPIFGQEKLDQIQNNDQRKFQACLESNIELCILDASGLKYFKPKNAEKYLNIIINLINSKLTP